MISAPFLDFLNQTHHKTHNQTVTVFLRSNKILDTIEVHATKAMKQWFRLPFNTGRNMSDSGMAVSRISAIVLSTLSMVIFVPE